MRDRATPMNKAQVRFILRFAGLLVLFYLITFHLAVWQSVIFGTAVLIFAFWTTRVRPIDAAATR